MRRHPFDAVSLIFGLVFLALAAAAVTELPLLAFLRPRWLLPLLVIALGVSLLASSLRRSRRRVD